jgi:hypothetical protein
MAKKKDDKKDTKASRTETVRAAVDQAFQATAQATADAGQLTRGRATEIADELVGNIARLRDALEDARPATADDVKALRTEITALGERVGRLEIARAAAAITGEDPAAKPSAGKPAARTAAAKKPAKRPAAAAKPRPAAPAKAGAAAAKPKPAAPAKTGAARK